MQTNYFRGISPFFKFIFFSAVFAVSLVILRLAVTHSPQFFFLGWNAFLAAIPWFISSKAVQKDGWQSGWKFYLASVIWLLFLPNAPYVLTDLSHLSYTPVRWLWLDSMTIIAFALPSLLMGLRSMYQMHTIWIQKFGRLKADALVVLVCFACGFGVYLGRYQRFNSWDVIHDPVNLVLEIADRFIHPLQHGRTWAMTVTTGLFLNLLWFGKNILEKTLSPSAHRR